MKSSVLLFGALVFVLGACGGSDGSSEGSSGSGRACVTLDAEGRPAVCTVYAGSVYAAPSSMDLLCQGSEVVEMERAKRCPSGDGLMGHCKLNSGEPGEMHLYYYLHDDDGSGAATLQGACERSGGSWSR